VAGEALAVIVESRGAGALPELLTAMDADDAGLRGQALFLADRVPGPEATGRWVEKARRMSPDIAAEIVGMLARRGEKAAWPYIRSVLGGAEESVRLAAIPAVPTLGGAEGLAALWPFLKTGSEAEIQAVHQALLQYPAEAVVPEAVRLLTEAPPSGRAALIDILGEKGAVEHIGLVHEAARSETPAVSRPIALSAASCRPRTSRSSSTSSSPRPTPTRTRRSRRPSSRRPRPSPGARNGRTPS
jgi:hypothetical protein